MPISIYHEARKQNIQKNYGKRAQHSCKANNTA
jgi:hypothetical protein